ncbi:MAG TPA: hypothetical protein VIJ14_03715 [Rhabdochlamydiaceae bacterium]
MSLPAVNRSLSGSAFSNEIAIEKKVDAPSLTPTVSSEAETIQSLLQRNRFLEDALVEKEKALSNALRTLAECEQKLAMSDMEMTMIATSVTRLETVVLTPFEKI